MGRVRLLYGMRKQIRHHYPKAPLVRTFYILKFFFYYLLK